MPRKRQRNGQGPIIPGLYLKRGKYVWQPPMVDGRRPSVIYLGTSHLSDAILQVDQMKRARFSRQAIEPMRDLSERFLDSKRRHGSHRSAITTGSARPGLNRFVLFFRGRPPASIRIQDLERWRDAMLAEDLSPASVAGYLRYAQSFCSWMVQRGHLHRNPFDDAKKRIDRLFPRSLPTRRDRYCSKDLRDRLIDDCPDLDLKAVLFFGFYTGMRRNEILNLRPSWIHTEGALPIRIEVRNERGDDGTSPFVIKDGDPKIIPIASPLQRFMTGELDWRHRSPYLIAPEIPHGLNRYRWDWRARWTRYMREQGCPWVTPHVLRHTWFTLLLSAAPDKRPSILHLERWSGTNSDTIKKHYAHLLEDFDLINAQV